MFFVTHLNSRMQIKIFLNRWCNFFHYFYFYSNFQKIQELKPGAQHTEGSEGKGRRLRNVIYM
jgi:hypothetical protein